VTGPASEKLEKDLADAGFLCLGGFDAADDAGLPALADGRPAKSLLLIGSTGASVWARLCESQEMADGATDPLDRYTRRTLRAIAVAGVFEAVFPFDGPPYHPFQQWAKKCGGFSQSPMGVLAHHDFGPWAGFRAAFLSGRHLAARPRSGSPGPCETCADKPCISACPVSALSLKAGYDVPVCREHMSVSRSLDCWSGCLARRACPYGSAHHQDPANARFHMESFIGQ